MPSPSSRTRPGRRTVPDVAQTAAEVSATGARAGPIGVCALAAEYRPPFNVTGPVLALVAEIAERIGRISALREPEANLRLRRINRIRTIQGTLAIEGSGLTMAQVTAILEGRRVLAPPREIQEARNALSAYDRLGAWTPSREADLLEAHGLLMEALMDEPGRYRRGGVGVMAADAVVHVAPPAHRVPGLMADLLGWLERGEDHPLIASSVLHYELEFIHPFADGNGRIGRLWQTLVLSRWRGLFADLPVETMVHAHQHAYYQAIADSTQAASATPFIGFMLEMIRAALDDLDDMTRASAGAPPVGETEQVTEQATDQVARLIDALGGDTCSAKTLMQRLGLRHRPSFVDAYLRPALDAGVVAMTDPEHPRSPRQRYRLTPRGRRLLGDRPQEQRSP